MTVLASFNYTEPSFFMVLAGTLALVAWLVFLGWTRRLMLGVFGGALGGATIAWFVLGRGSGDLVGLMQLIGAPSCGLVGALLGGGAAFFGKWRQK